MSQTNNNSLLITPTTQFNCGLDHGTNEFAIIGDDLVIESQNAVPDWFINIIGDTINGNLEDLYNNMYNYNYNLLQSLEQIEVAKNTYAQYISKVITDESAYVAALTTLNASIAESDATIRQLLSTYATRDFAVASAAQLLTAEINGGSISAKIGSVESAMATQYGAMAQRLNQLSSEFDSQSELGNANANAIELLTTYTGLGTVNGLPAVIANSNFYRQLDAYLEGTNYGDVGGTSNLIQDVTAISTEAASSVEAKFEYGSTITLDGKSYRAGFGLVQTGTVSSDGTTYDSEFWIDASKLRFTNSNRTGSVDPFTIDASGSTPQITFNGNVVINNRATALGGEGIPKFHGVLAVPPVVDIVMGDTYRKLSDSLIYTYTGTSWVSISKQTKVTGICFLRSNTQPTTPTGGSYDNSTAIGWSDGIPTGTGKCWWSSRIFTSDGLAPQDSAWSTPVELINTQYVEYEYSTTANGPWTNTAYDGVVYVRSRTNNNGEWTAWSVYRVKGEAGIPGANGDRGPRGTAIGYGASANNTAFTASTGLIPISGDQLVVTNSSGTTIYNYNGSGWTNATTLQINGNAVITGTLTADKIVSSSYLASGSRFGLGTTSVVRNSTGNVMDSAVIGESFGQQIGVLGHSTEHTGIVGGTFYGGAGSFFCAPTGSYSNIATASYHAQSGVSSTHHRYQSGGVVVKEVHTCTVDWAVIATKGKVYSMEGFAPFTGSHQALIGNTEELDVGDIVEDLDVMVRGDINNTLMLVTLSVKEKSKSPIGVYTEEVRLEALECISEQLDPLSAERNVIPIYSGLKNTHKGIQINALGEGKVNVCGLGGNLEPGDLITTSSIPGKGMRQDDDLVRNYTVAKCREYVEFDYPEQVKQVACIYMCG